MKNDEDIDLHDVTSIFLANPMQCPFCGEKTMCVNPDITISYKPRVIYEINETCAFCEKSITVKARVFEVVDRDKDEGD